MKLPPRVKPWMLVAAVWIWPAALNVISRLAHVKLDGWDAPSARELLFVAGDWLIYAIVTPFIFWISRRWPVVKPHVAQRVRIHLGFALLFCVVWAVGGKLFDLALVSLLDPDRLLAGISAAGNNLGTQLAKNVAGWILTTLPFGVVVYTTVAGMAHAIDYFTEAREREMQNAKLAEQLSGARFAALQAQLNPHFLSRARQRTDWWRCSAQARGCRYRGGRGRGLGSWCALSEVAARIG